MVILGPENYSVSMTYDNMGGIVQKNQTASLNYPGYPGEKYNYYYTLGNTSHPHATSKVWDRRNHKQYTYGFDNNGNPTTTHEQYAPPQQGQPNPSGPIDLIQENYWDEQNQLRGLWNLAGLHHYIYDADGQRLMKSSVPMSHGAVNAQSLQATNTIPSVEYTVYVSAGLVYESDGTSESYTKHYYAGPLRVASQIGSGNPNYETHPTSGGNLAQGGPVNAAAPTNGIAVLGDLNNMLANYGMSVSPSGMPTDTIAMQVINDPEECDQYYGNDVIEKNRCLCDNFPDVALGQGIDCSPYTPIYWYHPDYIGNVEFVTDRTGQPYQHFYYAAFGDPMVSQHVGTGSFNSAFRFNAKEYDEETGNYYYGARYYEPKSSIWMGVDALATSYPGMNPYNFTMGNPIMAIDPDGNDPGGTPGDDSPIVLDEVTVTATRLAPPPGFRNGIFHDGFYYGPTSDGVGKSTHNLWESIPEGYNSYTGYEYSLADLRIRYTLSQSHVLKMAIFNQEAAGWAEPMSLDAWVDFHGVSYYNKFRMESAISLAVGVASSAQGGGGPGHRRMQFSYKATLRSTKINFIVTKEGTVFPVPKGAIGPFPTSNYQGIQFVGGKGGYGFESRAFGFRFMDPITTGKYIYPKGYGNYFNRNGQAINPYTGRTLEPSDPMWHIRP